MFFIRQVWNFIEIIKAIRLYGLNRINLMTFIKKEISVDDSVRHGILIPQIPFESIGQGWFGFSKYILPSIVRDTNRTPAT